MVTSRQCFAKWGDPNTREDEGKYMVLWDVPTSLEIGVIPKRLYCNRAMIEPLTKAFNNIISRGYVGELRDWAGCFNIRKKRGASSQSLHAWGIAIDMNPTDNQFGWSREKLIAAGRKPFSDGFVKCFTDAGFDWGGTWSKPDSMHFQLAKI